MLKDKSIFNWVEELDNQAAETMCGGNNWRPLSEVLTGGLSKYPALGKVLTGGPAIGGMRVSGANQFQWRDDTWCGIGQCYYPESRGELKNPCEGYGWTEECKKVQYKSWTGSICRCVGPNGEIKNVW